MAKCSRRGPDTNRSGRIFWMWRSTIKACALHLDLEMLEDGDTTEIGAR